jgi:hypothetical protein
MYTDNKAIRDALMKCAKDAFDEVNATRVEQIPTNALNDLYLYGQQGVFDSLQLVDFILIFEEKIAEQVGATVTIVSAHALSTKVNPFGTVSHLIDYVVDEISCMPATKESREDTHLNSLALSQIPDAMK